jgi:hypothetical protein
MPSFHYPLSASGAARWTACTGSHAFEKFFADNSGEAAERGTLIHAYAEAFLASNLEHLYGVDFAPLTQGDKDVAMEYVGYVGQWLGDKNFISFVEKQIELTPRVGGTLDFGAFNDTVLHVVDLKTGRNAVAAEANKQLVIYAKGLLKVAREDYFIEPETVTLHIVQPHDGAPKVATYSAGAIDDMADEILAKAESIENGETEYVVGEHCKYCKARFFCTPRIEKLALDVAEAGSLAKTLGAAYKPETVGYYAARVDSYKKELDSLYQFAQNLALAGQPLPGTKLIAGRAMRYYTDPAALADKLIKEGHERAVIYKSPELVGITEMESLLGKKGFATISAGLVDKKQGAPKLVSADAKGDDYKPETKFNQFI